MTHNVCFKQLHGTWLDLCAIIYLTNLLLMVLQVVSTFFFFFGCYRHSYSDDLCSYPCPCPYLVGILLQGVPKNIFNILINLPNFSKKSPSNLF